MNSQGNRARIEGPLEEGSPSVCRQLQLSQATIDIYPRDPFEVYFVADRDLIAFGTNSRPMSVGLACDSDRVHEFKVNPGSIHFHPAGSRIYGYSREANDGFCVMGIGDELAQRIRQDFDHHAPLQNTLLELSTPHSQALANTVGKLHAEAGWRNNMVAEAVAVMAMSQIMEAQQSTPAPAMHQAFAKATHERFNRVIDFVEAHLGEHITLADMADQAHMSLYHFSRSFKKAIGLSPNQYVTQRRLRRAQELLLNSRLAIVDIAQECGFRSQSYLTRCFQEHMGVTPSKYRRQVLS